MSAEPNVASWRLGRGVPAAFGSVTPCRAFVAVCTWEVPQTSTTSTSASATSPSSIDRAGATSATAAADGEAGSGDQQHARRVAQEAVRLPRDEPESESCRQPQPPRSPPREQTTRRGQDGCSEGGEEREGAGAPGDEVQHHDAHREQARRHQEPDEADPRARRASRRYSHDRRLNGAERRVRRDEPQAQGPGVSGWSCASGRFRIPSRVWYFDQES